MRALTVAHPALAALPFVALSDGPSPVAALPRAAAALGLASLHVKEDGRYGTVYGGNKLRKLELVLGDARARGCDALVVSGRPGSNHVLASALAAAQLGMQVVALLLTPQAPSTQLRQNVARLRATGAELVAVAPGTSLKIAAPTTVAVLDELRRRGRTPHVLPFAGSDPLGTIGYVNAAFELRAQIDAGLLPAPERIYVALGSLGTAAGLLVGLRAVGLDARLIAVRVVDAVEAPPSRLVELAEATAALVRRRDATFATVALDGWQLRADQAGAGYGWFTEAGAHAAGWLMRHERRRLDGGYTGKAFAALLADAPAGARVLFWDTADALAPPAPPLDTGALPPLLRDNLMMPPQPFDDVFTLLTDEAA